jgi:alanine dehydrogenase
MIIGTPKEAKPAESRVGLTPQWVQKLTGCGHEVLIQSTAGVASGFSDEEYRKAGARIVPSIEGIYEQAEFVVKVKELMSAEYGMIRERQMIMAWFHMAEDVWPQMTRALLASRATTLSMELIVLPDGLRPTIKPMSEITGTLAVFEAIKYLQYGYGGKGILLRKLPGLPVPKLLILGGGNAGMNAAQVALGLGLRVTVMESMPGRIQFLAQQLPQAEILCWDDQLLARAMGECDVFINSIYPQPGESEPMVTREMVRGMKKGAVIIDVAGGGTVETARYTTLEAPIFFEEEILHYCVDNMPALCPQTSTAMMLMATGPYVLDIANKGLRQALSDDPVLRQCISTCNGEIVHREVGINQRMPYKEFYLDMLDS